MKPLASAQRIKEPVLPFPVPIDWVIIACEVYNENHTYADPGDQDFFDEIFEAIVAQKLAEENE